MEIDNEKGFGKRYEPNQSKKLHFPNMHLRISNKYEEIQRRIEKSRSMDSIANLDENSEFREVNKEHEFLRETSHAESDNSVTMHKFNAVITDVQKNEADIFFSEVAPDISTSPKQIQAIDSDMHHISIRSLESLNEVFKGSNEYLNAAPTPPIKVSIRDKIGSRISAAKEKRRREEIEKNAAKDKKKERQKVEKLILSNTTKHSKVIYKKEKLATVTIALIEATGLDVDATEDKPKLFLCRFKLGAEKYKSKTAKCKASDVKWQELFNFNLFDETLLEISLFEKDMLVGRTVIDVSEIEKEKTHQMRINLDAADSTKPQIFILLTISGLSLVDTVIDLDHYQASQQRVETIRKKYAWYKIPNKLPAVGWLSIIVYGAKGLSGHDCFCVLQLANERLLTNTEYRTNDPSWMKIFTFTVTDITSILEITVHDEKKSEDVGKISIPLLNIDSSLKKWYALKDNRQRERAKGHNPKILLEMKVGWNLIKASFRVINPKETLFLEADDKFDRQVFTRNVTRTKAVVEWIIDAFKVFKMMFEWESKKLNIIALAIWLLLCTIFRPWMLPLIVLVPFVYYRPEKYKLFKRLENQISTVESIDGAKGEKEEKSSSLRQKIQSLQDLIQTVQNMIGSFASLGESIKNLCNFTVPFLSFLAIFMLILIAFVMYLIPVRYIFMIWGIHKFTRKILRPNRIPNNEILDLLSRVPDDEILQNCEELPLENVPENDSSG